MIVIQSGFSRVREIVLGANQLAIRSDIEPLTPEATARFPPDYLNTPDLRITLDVELWSLPPEESSQRYSRNACHPFDLQFDVLGGCFLWGEHDGSWGGGPGLKRLDGTVVIPWSPPSSRLFKFAISPDGNRLLCLGLGRWREPDGTRRWREGYQFVLYDRTGAEWGDPRTVRSDAKHLSHSTFLAHGTQFASVLQHKGKYQKGQPRRRAGKELTIFDATTIEVVSASDRLTVDIDQLVGCGQFILAMSKVRFDDERENHLHIWDSQALARKPTSLGDVIAALAADPCGNFLLTASRTTVSVWDPKTWTIAKTYDWKAGPITCLAVAPDGLTAAAGTATGKVVVWDVE